MAFSNKMRTEGTRLTSGTKPFKKNFYFILLSSLGGGKRPQHPEGARSALTELPSHHRRGRGSCRGPPPPPTPTGQARSAAAARTSAALQVPAQQLGREPSGRRLQPRRPAPRPLPAPRGLCPHSAPRPFARPPAPPARGSCRLTAAPALSRASRAPSRPLRACRPQADKDASWRPH